MVSGPQANGQGTRNPRSRRKLLFWLAAAAVASVLVIVVSLRWPFNQKHVLEKLQEASDSRVQIRSFHQLHFPNPGCILEGVSFLHGSDATAPLITIERLTIRTTYLGILAHHLGLIAAEGLHIQVPPFGTSRPIHSHSSAITVGEIVANGAILEFISRNPQKAPLRFDIHEASLRELGANTTLTYRVKVHNPEPPGEITASGKFGAWNDRDPSATPVSGEYKFENADLSVYGGIAGKLTSAGKFSGTVGHININGLTDTPDFEVTHSGHPVQLVAEFSAYVDATHGNVFLKRVDAHFRKTRVIAQGSIAKSPGRKGKTALLTLTASNGRIEDILGLFVSADRSPMSGVANLRADVEIPPGHRPFLEKLKLRGIFGVAGGEFSKPSTQEDVNKLSAGARGEKDRTDPDTVLTDLTGHVAVDEGSANFADLSFGIPGATARLHGTYNLENHKIDLRGQMKVASKISNTTSGAKALLLRVLDPFFKKRKKGELLPVKIGGTYEKPTFGLDPMDKRAQVPPPPESLAKPKQ